MIENINKKIDKIDSMLLDIELFDKYINDMELMKCDVPEDLDNKILKKIRFKKINNEETTVKKINKFYFKDIIKIAACTVFAIMMWQFVLSKPTAYAGNENMNVKKNEIYNTIDEKMKMVNEFFMKPVSVKGEK